MYTDVDLIRQSLKFSSTKIPFQALKYYDQGLTVCTKLAGYMYVYKTQGLIDFEVATAPVH